MCKERAYISCFIKSFFYKSNNLHDVHKTLVAGCARLDICPIFTDLYLSHICYLTYFLSPIEGRSFPLLGGWADSNQIWVDSNAQLWWLVR